MKGRGHLSDDSDMEEGGSDLESGDEEIDREMRDDVPDREKTDTIRSVTTVASKPPPVFNASGSLGVTHIMPQASTSSIIDAESTRPMLPPAKIPAIVGSGLAKGVTVTMVKRKKKEKGKMRALVGAVGKGKGKAKEEESESDFDSSDDGNDEEDGEAEGEDGGEEAWGGIPTEAEREEGVKSDKEEGEGSSLGEEEEESESDSDETQVPRARGSFQSWAELQVLLASGQTSSLLPSDDPHGAYVPLLPAGSGFKSLPDPSGVTGPLGAILTPAQLPTLPPQRSTFIQIDRTEEMKAQRADLPIVKEEDRIMEAIRGNPVVVICGETGSGKTTQIGQFLWEAGWGDKDSDNPGMVAITQPRRVAALSTSVRVRAELCLPPNSTLVAHRIRYSSTTGADTKLVFMTDGVLLRELAGDFLLSKYSVVVIDEAHERGVNTDVLIGVLSRVARLREEMWKSGKEGMKVCSRSIVHIHTCDSRDLED